MRRLPLAALVLAGLAAATPGVAEAAQRYASPTGEGLACTSKAPCSLETAVNESSSNDEVIIATGTYPTSKVIAPPVASINVNVHGDLGAPAPLIVTSLSGSAMRVETGRLEHVEVLNDNSAPRAVSCGAGAVVARVRATAVGPGAKGIYDYEGGCLIVDSVAGAVGEAATAADSHAHTGVNTTIRNLTAIASGDESVGLYVFGEDARSVDVKNSILSGTTEDIKVSAFTISPIRVEISNSNFESVTAPAPGVVDDKGANQKAPPLFVDAAKGDYREAAGSPTIDAGLFEPALPRPFDLAGNPRLLGPAPDIGAYEFVPPPGQIQSLKATPGVFRAGNVGDAVISRKKKAPIGAKVSYSLSGDSTVAFTIERKLRGRRAGGKCVKQTGRINGHKACALFKPVKGGFSVNGAAGANRFKFSGRVGGKALKPGRYRLVGEAGSATRRATFTIVR